MTPMRHALALAAAVALALALPATAQTARPGAVVTASSSLVTLEGAERAAAIAQANSALNAIQRLQARFVQTAPDGARATGDLYIQRPGRLRFQYDSPATILIVSDGSVVSLRDTALRTTERTPLRSTPLSLILGERIDLERNARIIRVSRQGEWTLVTARDRAGQTDGVISLKFNDGQLREWDVVDATGARTNIALTNVTQPASLDRGLFRLEDVLAPRRR